MMGTAGTGSADGGADANAAITTTTTTTDAPAASAASISAAASDAAYASVFAALRTGMETEEQMAACCLPGITAPPLAPPTAGAGAEDEAMRVAWREAVADEAAAAAAGAAPPSAGGALDADGVASLSLCAPSTSLSVFTAPQVPRRGFGGGSGSSSDGSDGEEDGAAGYVPTMRAPGGGGGGGPGDVDAVERFSLDSSFDYESIVLTRRQQPEWRDGQRPPPPPPPPVHATEGEPDCDFVTI